ncbi:MAG: peptidoglycan DD-metalloendopeptidase family protein [Bdellovibrionales bacterium]|nr:peptidoglycan DD-metalloendopeptidase family protein [Bdellovibrionales bacterium]
MIFFSLLAPNSFASISQKIKPGDTLYSLLKRENFNEKQVRKILVNSPLPRKYHLTSGDLYQITRDKGYREIKLHSPYGNTAYLFWSRGSEEAGAKAIEEKYDVQIVKAEGYVNGSLLAALTDKVGDQRISYRFLDAYVHRYQLNKVLARGAKFSLTYEKLFQNGAYIKPGEILETSLMIHDRQVVRKLVRFPGGASFIDPAEPQLDRSLYAPVNYQSISSRFQKRRFHPIKRRRIAHLGIDYALPPGEPVYAAYAGRVIKKGRSRGAGIYVALRHPNGLETYYNHLSSYRKDIKVGDYVGNGEEVGKVGCTGYCTKPHLHFAIKLNRTFVDPLKFVRTYPFIGKYVIEKQIAQSNHSKNL